ncbi:MAG: GC-type dockerin domain-anchored protein [Phycisphaerales bacterium]|nr:GC-type dockerin domain-anchored protein [Phycisphaerales bacterium]
MAITINARLLLLGTTVALTGADRLHAGAPTLVQYSTMQTFLAATGPLPVIENFETAGPRDTLLPTLVLPVGVFTALDGEPFANVYILGPGAANFGVAVTSSTVLTANGNEDWRLDFASPVSAFGFETYLNGSGPGTLTVFGPGGAVLGTFTQSHNSTQIGYLGITSETAIGSIRFTTVNGRQINTGIDNIRVRAFPSPCVADIGVQGGVAGHDGVLDNNDFIVLIDYFFMQDARADFGAQGGAPGPDGAFDNNDFIVFIDRFFGGCS